MHQYEALALERKLAVERTRILDNNCFLGDAAVGQGHARGRRIVIRVGFFVHGGHVMKQCPQAFTILGGLICGRIGCTHQKYLNTSGYFHQLLRINGRTTRPLRRVPTLSVTSGGP
jgi:hypothetical protein